MFSATEILYEWNNAMELNAYAGVQGFSSDAKHFSMW